MPLTGVINYVFCIYNHRKQLKLTRISSVYKKVHDVKVTTWSRPRSTVKEYKHENSCMTRDIRRNVTIQLACMLQYCIDDRELQIQRSGRSGMIWLTGSAYDPL